MRMPFHHFIFNYKLEFAMFNSLTPDEPILPSCKPTETPLSLSNTQRPLCQINQPRKPNPGIRLRNAKLLNTTLILLNAMARLAHTGSRVKWPPLGVRTA